MVRLYQKRCAEERLELAGCYRRIRELKDALRRERSDHNHLFANHSASIILAESRRKMGDIRKSLTSEHAQANKKAETLRKLEHALSIFVDGEAEALADWVLRTGQTYDHSWEALADMQHFRVPTRLLDWTEVPLFAVYFALRMEHSSDTLMSEESNDYWHACIKLWNNSPEPENPLPFPSEDLLDSLYEACIWVLNPYLLAERVTGESRVFDYTVLSEFDYRDSFLRGLDSKWPWKGPVPMYAPWKDERRRAQQSMFTVFGRSRDPLEVQHRSVVRKVCLTRNAAVYAVHQLHHLAGIERFALFRDKDALGDRIASSFIIRPTAGTP
jgi:FRG domain